MMEEIFSFSIQKYYVSQETPDHYHNHEVRQKFLHGSYFIQINFQGKLIYTVKKTSALLLIVKFGCLKKIII
jgi:hypothetical protein